MKYRRLALASLSSCGFQKLCLVLFCPNCCVFATLPGSTACSWLPRPLASLLLRPCCGALLGGYFEYNRPRPPRLNQGKTPGDEAGATMHFVIYRKFAIVSEAEERGMERGS